LSIVKKTVAAIIVVGIIVVFGYIVLTMAQSPAGQRGGEQDGGFLASDNVRTFVTLGVVGGSAFITGFGVRDVISRALAARKYMHMRAAREQKSL